MDQDEVEQMSEPGNTPELLDDIIKEILARLPSKSLRRFRCVSCSWGALLTSEIFIELHLRRANQGRYPKLFHPWSLTERNHEVPVYSWEPTGLVKRSQHMDKVPTASLLSTTTPCRGLVLLDRFELSFDNDISHHYYVLNPSTGELLDLPHSSPPLDVRGYHDHRGWDDRLFGLGYDQSAKEYKVVRIYSYEGSTALSDTLHCEVFTLGASPHWRAVAGCPPLQIIWKQRDGVFSNGRLHWMLITDFRADDDYIHSFNIQDETFETVKPPPGIRTSYMDALMELDGCLGLSCHSSGWDGEEAIWMLRDYKASRWEKCYAFDRRAWPMAERALLGTNHIIPLAMYCGDGQKRKIMFMSNYGLVFAVDMDSGALEILHVPEPGDRVIGENPKLQLFEESLVSAVHP